jgi:hypothetical protein
MKVDLSKVKIGDKIWTIQEGWTEVKIINQKYNFPITTSNANKYQFDGKRFNDDRHPSAFLEYPFGLEVIEKDTLVWYRDYEDESWKFGYYCCFKGKHWVYVASQKSTQTDKTISYKIVTTENPLK